MPAAKGAVYSGRKLPRSRSYGCHSCGIRNAVGEPRVVDTWAARLHAVPLTEEQMELLLVAAAEFVELCQASGEPDGSVAFLDWVRPDALNTTARTPVLR